MARIKYYTRPNTFYIAPTKPVQEDTIVVDTTPAGRVEEPDEAQKREAELRELSENPRSVLSTPWQFVMEDILVESQRDFALEISEFHDRLCNAVLRATMKEQEEHRRYLEDERLANKSAGQYTEHTDNARKNTDWEKTRAFYVSRRRQRVAASKANIRRAIMEAAVQGIPRATTSTQ